MFTQGCTGDKIRETGAKVVNGVGDWVQLQDPAYRAKKRRDQIIEAFSSFDKSHSQPVEVVEIVGQLAERDQLVSTIRKSRYKVLVELPEKTLGHYYIFVESPAVPQGANLVDLFLPLASEEWLYRVYPTTIVGMNKTIALINKVQVIYS